VRAGRRDCTPNEAHLRRQLAGFDWAARSRVAEDGGRRLEGAVLVTDRSTAEGTLARVDPFLSADSPALLEELTRWGLGLSRAAGAGTAHVWMARGHGAALRSMGLEVVRPWWRMDRSLAGDLPGPSPVPGYELLEGPAVAAGTWAEVHNNSFADHWRYSPRGENELMAGRPSNLALLAVLAGNRSPAAVTLCQIETYMGDARPQPVGIVGSVGTLPGHRRRGLATWMVAEALSRLRESGARHASLYVDGRNTTRAFDAYRKVGFELAFEAEVWEARFS
jgi:ribosomal protein S18 acetylase RimI-like enzyme